MAYIKNITDKKGQECVKLTGGGGRGQKGADGRGGGEGGRHARGTSGGRRFDTVDL